MSSGVVRGVVFGVVWADWIVWSFVMRGWLPGACFEEFVCDWCVCYRKNYRWVCAIWLGSMLTISMVICCILVCLMGFTAPRPDSNKYEQVNSGQNV